MSGAAARAEMGRLAARGGWARSRAERFLARDVARPSFAALHAMPRWPVLDADGRETVGMVALLIAGQSALSRTIEGAKLRGYADLVGADVLERVMTFAEGGRDPLPAIDRMSVDAQRLLVAADADEEAAGRLGAAEILLKEADAWPSI